MSTISARVTELFAKETGRKPAELLESTRLEEFDLDSLERVELILKLEKEFGFEFEEEAAAGLTTIGEAIAYVAGRCTETPQPRTVDREPDSDPDPLLMAAPA
jgi:acyl carrier protein